MTDDDRDPTTVAVFAVVISVAGACAIVAWNVFSFGYCLSHIWALYAVAQYGFAPIGWKVFGVAAIGFRLLLPKGDYTGKDERTPGQKSAGFVAAFAVPWLTLLVAWWLS